MGHKFFTSEAEKTNSSKMFQRSQTITSLTSQVNRNKSEIILIHFFLYRFLIIFKCGTNQKQKNKKIEYLCKE